MQSQEQLIKGCLKNDAKCQQLLYNQYAVAMMGLCYRYTKSVPDAEDILQEAFIRVFRSLHQYNGSGELGAWIRRITVNTAINYLKKSARYQQELVFENVFSQDALHPVSDLVTDFNLSAKELANIIRQLPTGYQTIFNLHAIEGYTHVEIGQILGIKETTSRTQYFKARALLAKWINQAEEYKTKSENHAG